MFEHSFTDKTKKLIQQIAESKRFDFILGYSEQKDLIVNMIKTFGTEWMSFFADFFAALNIGEAPTDSKTKNDAFISKCAYTLLTLIGDNSTRTTFLDDVSKECLVEYLSNDANFLSIYECDDKNVALGIHQLGISFKAINLETANRSLLKQIYCDNSYVINYGNIETMIKAFYSTPNLSALQTANYSVIMANAESPLSKYINANIDDYMTVFLAECGNVITDIPKNVILLLNNDTIEKSKKLLYITYLKSTIVEILDVNDKDLWSELLRNPTIVEYTAKNIVAYFVEKCNNTFDDVLLNYVNNNNASVTLADCFEDDDQKNNFFTATVKAISLNNDIYKKIIEQFNLHYNNFSIDGLSQEKLMILDELNKIKLSADSLTFMREHYINYLYTFIVGHIAEYTQIITDLTVFVFEEALELLNTEIKDSDKIAILKLDTRPISIKDKKYSDAVTVHILQNNYYANDFNHLLESYSSFEKQTQMEIVERAINNIKNVLLILNNIDRQLLLTLFASDKVIEENKQNMFRILSPTASGSDIQSWLSSIGSKEFLVLYEERKRPKIENTEWNKSLLDIFKERKLIKDYELDEQNQKYSIIRWRKGQSKDD